MGIYKKCNQDKKDSFTEKIVLGVIGVIIIVMLLKCNIVKKLIIPRKEQNSHYEVENIEKPINNSSQKDDESEKNKNNQNNSTTVTQQPTIEEYLSKLFCTGYGRHCPLTNSACGRGMSMQIQKIQKYNQTYHTNETYTSTRNNRPVKKQ